MSIRLAGLLALAASLAWGAPKRLVILKVDGLPKDIVQKYLDERDPLSGKSRLPWLDRIFRQQGASVDNFYVRGISLSAPSWSMLDTGRNLVIRGNAEYDRYTLRVYDYLNFFPFYVGYARAKRADMPGVEVLDEAGVPLLIDRYPSGERYQSMQLYQRGVSWETLGGTLVHRITSRTPGQLFNEWQLGFELGKGVNEQVERELIAKLADPNVRYLDFFVGDYDHVGHLTNDAASQYGVIRQLDTLAGRIWTAIQGSELADQTIFVLVSDHGMNTDPAVISQGYSLIDFFGSAEGGGHHVITNRHPLTEYKLKGLDPFVSEVVTPSAHSFYLKDQADDYPTALLDLDGNERACVQLRNNRLNELQILLQRPRDSRAIFQLLDEQRASWERTLKELDEELGALRRLIARLDATVKSTSVKWAKSHRKEGAYLDLRRQTAQLHSWQEDEVGYSAYARALARLLRMEPKQFESSKPKTDELIPKRVMGDPNTIYDLQNYAVGPGTDGFRRVNYFELITGVRVRNNVQAQVSSKPVDFVAVRCPVEAPDEEGIWVYESETSQALILSRRGQSGLELRYVPVQGLRQDRSGKVTYTEQPWRDGLPLRIFEDPQLSVPGDRAEWLSGWHTDREWLEAVHQTAYSNAIIGLQEELSRDLPAPAVPPKSADEIVLRRFEERKRHLAQADLLILASNHWNFNTRGFNPGGNHGSFFRISTHSVFMLAGAGIPEGLRVERPYDSLSFMPTLLSLTGLASPDELKRFPGPVIDEFDPNRHRSETAEASLYNCCR
ncbi:MAG TPA: alkaline phosphatase family protein [Bryobacteraceae bacterium]|nr:alkaline phosphatase family protein [Bryobacteraceae bacterium]